MSARAYRTDLYPAIDLRGGRVVRLTKGDYDAETVYGDDPVSVALSFVAAGAPWVHVVDGGAGVVNPDGSYAQYLPGGDGLPVEGLYAAGEVAGFGGGGMHGYRALEGTFLGGCIFSGRNAGRSEAIA